MFGYLFMCRKRWNEKKKKLLRSKKPSPVRNHQRTTNCHSQDESLTERQSNTSNFLFKCHLTPNSRLLPVWETSSSNKTNPTKTKCLGQRLSGRGAQIRSARLFLLLRTRFYSAPLLHSAPKDQLVAGAQMKKGNSCFASQGWWHDKLPLGWIMYVKYVWAFAFGFLLKNCGKTTRRNLFKRPHIFLRDR